MAGCGAAPHGFNVNAFANDYVGLFAKYVLRGAPLVHIKKKVVGIKMAGLGQNSIFKIAFLTFLWIILREGFTFFDLIIGAVLSTGCVAYSKKFLPLTGIRNIRPFRMTLYVFYLLGQIYVAGFHVIKVIIHGRARADILLTRTEIENETLRVILGDSITLTPGTIMLDLNENVLAVLLLAKEDEVILPDEVDDRLKGGLEQKLISCQKDSV